MVIALKSGKLIENQDDILMNGEENGQGWPFKANSGWKRIWRPKP